MPARYRKFIYIALIALLGYRFFVEIKSLQIEPIRAWKEDFTGDCAVVLTGGGGRLREAIALVQRKSIQWLIISGVHSSTSKTDLLTPWEIIWGVDQEKIILEKNSQSTYGNALQSLAILEALQCHKVLLVTSTIHMSRAFKTFESVLPESISLQRYSVAPARSEVSWTGLATEALKSLFYSLWAY